jgi:hypothetical protein
MKSLNFIFPEPSVKIFEVFKLLWLILNLFKYDNPSIICFINFFINVSSKTPYYWIRLYKLPPCIYSIRINIFY